MRLFVTTLFLPCLIVFVFISNISPRSSATESEFLPGPVCLNGKTVFVNKSGEVVLKTDFDYFWAGSGHFSEGLASFKQDGKYGYFDKTGRILIEPSAEFGLVGPFQNGFAQIFVNNKFGFIDKTGRIVIPPVYFTGSTFENGFSAVMTKQSAKKTNVVGSILSEIDDEFADLKTLAFKWALVDTSGKPLTAKIGAKGFREFNEARSFSEGLAAVRIGKKWGYIDSVGNFVIDRQFEKIGPFSEGLAAVTKDGKKWGYIDKSGKFEIEPTYLVAEPFSEGMAAVVTTQNPSDGRKFIDKTGKIVLETGFSFVGVFREGLVVIRKPTGFGYADKSGTLLNTIQLNGAGAFENGVAHVYPNYYGEDKMSYGWGYIDTSGRYIWDPRERNTRRDPSCNN